MTNDIEGVLLIIIALQLVILFAIYICYRRLFIRTTGQINRLIDTTKIKVNFYIHNPSELKEYKLDCKRTMLGNYDVEIW
jgi:hypothetical protein